MKIVRVIIFALLVVALIMVALIFLPTKGKLSGQIISIEYPDTGASMHTVVIISNSSNKPAFGVKYTITVTTADGIVVGTYESESIGIMMPHSSERFEESFFLDVPCDDGDVEISVTGYLFE